MIKDERLKTIANIPVERGDYVVIKNHTGEVVCGVMVSALASELLQARQDIAALKPKYSDIPCCECGGKVEEFTVPNELWNAVMRPDGYETDKEYLCFECWNKRLMRHIAVLAERLKAAQDDAEWLALILRAIRNHREEIAQYIPTGIDDVLSRHEALVAQEAE
jgi:DNA-directed RNA polymerase subunit RPC12/RpoP